MSKLLLKKLSAREKQVFILLSEGLRYKEMAIRLNISIETVRTHVRNIYKKLEVSSRTDALNRVFKRPSNYY
ncbi:MAG TPA: LuxR C-terminal-related transcriptional regulator [Bacteroidia bacterium]|jgi:LuxR family maltose regulon positive regulatory protein|nr:LuxR C-terminal-related transcriptional regulator [Bacteroidia bacterium]